jgi:hypothetical protein
MRMEFKRLSMALAAALVGVCAVSLPVNAAETAPAPSVARKAPIKVYEPGALAPGAYTVIDRLWASNWRSVFDVPRYPDAESAIRAFLNEAERLGGDGVVNMHCMQSAGVVSRWGGHYCYGSVIKLKI